VALGLVGASGRYCCCWFGAVIVDGNCDIAGVSVGLLWRAWVGGEMISYGA
jgi:hypothetical protein